MGAGPELRGQAAVGAHWYIWGMSFEELLQGLKAGRIPVTIQPRPSMGARDFSVAAQFAVDHSKRLRFSAEWGQGRMKITRKQADQLLAAGAVDNAGLRPSE